VEQAQRFHHNLAYILQIRLPEAGKTASISAEFSSKARIKNPAELANAPDFVFPGTFLILL